MQQYAREDASSPQVVQLARDIRLSSTKQDQLSLVESAWWWVKRNVQFTQDEESAVAGGFGSDVIEILIRPRDMIQLCRTGGCRRMGDCDDFSMLLASLLIALGIPAGDVFFRTVAADGRDPNRYSHVYVAARINGVMVPLDASHGTNPGWETVNKFGKREDWPVGGCNTGALIRLGVLAMIAFYGARYMKWL